MPERPAPKTGRAARPRPSRTARHAAPGPLHSLREAVSHPGFIPAAGVWLLLVAMSVVVLAMPRGRLLIAEGRILTESRTARVDFSVVDEARTERERAARSLTIPRCYTADERIIKEIEASLRSLPSALAAAQTLEEVAPEIRASFRLTQQQFDDLRTIAESEAGLAAWNARVSRFMSLLSDHPVVSAEEFQIALADPAQRIEVRLLSGVWSNLPESAALSAGADNTHTFRSIAAAAGFTGHGAEAAVQRLATDTRPTFVFDKATTDARRAAAAAEVRPHEITYRAGEVLGRRGETVRPEQLALMRREMERFREMLPLPARIGQWIGIVGVAGVIAGAFGVYVRLFYARIALSTPRFLALVVLVAGGAALACWATIEQPGWLWATTIAPVVFCAMVAVVAFDARLALATAAAQCALVGTALSLPLGYFAVIISATGLAAWRLRDVRSRNDVVRAAVTVGAGLALATAAVTLLTRPMLTPGAELWAEVLSDALRAGLSGFFAGALTLVVLPTVERLFDVTTGMTLSEWRDPKQPLLRRLQMQAPGTFNHSHTVATLAEAAAEAIGADGLHVYVGALYHDIGKMNKPDYFVENQPRGFNRHSKLSPAMSLLVIIGHVKDGIELAREYGLPSSLIGYIETHHGTTLVEYFYDQARRQAEEGDEGTPTPQELEYRYPGPRPRTREQAILMICDAVESATRAMPEPTPSRIQTLVHSLATRRLTDGQFDGCDLTLADLSRIEEAVSRTLASIYHGRIAYPSSEQREKTGEKRDHGDTRTALAEQAG